MTQQHAEGQDAELLALLRQHEGEVRDSETERHVAYDDGTGLPIKPGTHVSGHPTAGYGRLLSGGRGLSDDEAEYLLRNDVAAVRGGLDREIPWWRTLPRKPRMAVVDMAVNLGVPGLMQFDRMLGHLRTAVQALETEDAGTARQEFELAAQQALDSLWASQVGDRAQTDANLIRAGSG